MGVEGGAVLQRAIGITKKRCPIIGRILTNFRKSLTKEKPFENIGLKIFLAHYGKYIVRISGYI
tara:strand:- start:2455 stop:2646 length:192 start_codon:yes stop_codon:yes gene_type:complete